MTREQASKLVELIDAKIAEAFAHGSSDGGLIETLRVHELHKELLRLCEDGEL